MKTVYSNSNEVIHLFAQQTQMEAKNTSRNVFFYGTKIYSYGYHYLLGEFLTDDTILINNSGHSVTTSKHISQLRYASSQYNQFLVSETDVKSVLSTIELNFSKLKKARKPIKYISEINYYFEALNRFLDWSTKNKFYKNQKSSSEYRRIKSIHKIANKDVNLLGVELKKLAAQEKRKKSVEVSKKLKAFLKYDIDTFRVGERDYLRLSQDNKNVETSQGIKIAVNECRVLYACILEGKNIKGKNIGGYTVTSINGTLKIGCHNIDIKSVHNVGKRLI